MAQEDRDETGGARAKARVRASAGTARPMLAAEKIEVRNGLGLVQYRFRTSALRTRLSTR